MPTNGHRDLVRAVCENPDDDLPRLAYADWLDDHGDPARAEFIRVQVRLPQLGYDRRNSRKERDHLEARQRELLDRHLSDWQSPFADRLLKPWPDGERLKYGRPGFHRGFAEFGSVTVDAARRLVMAGHDLEPTNPLGVYEDWGGYDPAGLVEIGRSPEAARIWWLCLNEATDADASAIATSLTLRNLTHLKLLNGTVTDVGVSALARWPLAAGLEELILDDNPGITDAGASALADSPYLGRLDRLELDRTGIGPAGRARLRARFGLVFRFVLEPPRS